jgi:hypothetical protein
MTFVSQTKPGFDIINILPSVILGYNELVTSTSSMALAGTNRFVVGIINGVSQTATPIGATVHVVCRTERYRGAESPSHKEADYET